MSRRILTVFILLVVLAPCVFAQKNIGINVVLNTPITDSMLAELGLYGTVRDTVPEIRAVTMQGPSANLAVIQKLSFVAAANPDQQRKDIPVHPMAADDFSAGLSTWDQDAINVTTSPFINTRAVPYDGSGVFVAVLDTGLLNTWSYYFPAERIATQYAVGFGGGGGEVGTVSSQPNKWETDQDSHGTHVVSSIIGYNYSGVPINGAAPLATIIPVKVLNQVGWGWSSVIARGIVYIADLKAGALSGSPVIISMSLGGPSLDAMEKAAIDYAIANGVIVVAAAGNEGNAGMGYPGAYAPVISVAAVGWTGEWLNGRTWWRTLDVPDPNKAANFYIADFSSREKPGQQLDVAGPGSWVVGPYQTNGQLSYYFLGGTSMATPHVSGIVALMAQKKPSLTAARAEAILKATALPLPPGCRTVLDISGAYVQYCWGADANGAGLAQADAALKAIK